MRENACVKKQSQFALPGVSVGIAHPTKSLGLGVRNKANSGARVAAARPKALPMADG